MATLTLLPAAPKVGDTIVIQGDGFDVSTKCAVAVTKQGLNIGIEIVSDDLGSFSSADEANPATATLTSDATNVAEDDTVTIGAITYTFKDAPSAENEVLVGADAEESLANVKKAVNLTGEAGTDYGADTEIHPTVTATTLTATTLKLVAKTAGTGGNSLTSTEGSTHLSFPGGATFGGGAAASGLTTLSFKPTAPGKYTVTASDGTNSASAIADVFTQGA